jgi:signal transduction histidine kinase
VALLLASLAGYGVAAAALGPVEAIRRAAEIGDADAGQRLPVAAAHDGIACLGETLNAMLDRLEAGFDRERTFVSDASHELRTPLAILKTELELALRAGRSPAELVDALRSAAEETDRLSQLAEDCLDRAARPPAA